MSELELQEITRQPENPQVHHFMHGFSVEDTPRFARGGIDTARGGS